MSLRLVLAFQTEFLRLLVQQLLRNQVGIEIVGEVQSLGAAVILPHATALLIERVLYDLEPDGGATACRRFEGRVLVIGEGERVDLPSGTLPGSAIPIPAGTATAKLEPALLRARLSEAFKQLRQPFSTALATPPPPQPPDARSRAPSRQDTARRPALVGIAASTGGPVALQELFEALDPPICPIFVALHIPQEHTTTLVSHLGKVTGHTVVVGEAGPVPQRAIVLLQGGADYACVGGGPGLALRRVRDCPSNFHPNADVLFTSIAELRMPSVGVILTGMGNDGSKGALALAERGYPVLAQRPTTCAAAGMASAAIATGAVVEIASLGGIARRLNEWFRSPGAVDSTDQFF
jgi:two-component system, chemotaxis family, protein-glutamate methylesterase/glutaminase